MSKELENIFGLKFHLNKVGWSHKESLYNSYIDKIKIQKAIKEPKVSIVIISWQFNKQMLENFKSLDKQRHTDFELIFVNNGKGDDEFASILPLVDTYIRLNTNTGAYKARNIGSVFANAPILFFLEDDGVAHKNLVESHLKAFEQYKVISVRGVCKVLTENKLNKLAQHYYLGSKAFPYFGNLEGNTSYDAQAFYEVGGWSDDINFGHGGPELSYRLTKRFPDKREQIYCPEPIIYHDYAKNEEHLEVKRVKQKISYKALKEKYPDYDGFIKSWDLYFRKPYYLKRKKVSLFSSLTDGYYYLLEEIVKPLVRLIKPR
jgi:glycosyltransferase involved in cell wall biosynthesis